MYAGQSLFKLQWEWSMVGWMPFWNKAYGMVEYRFGVQLQFSHEEKK